MTTVNAIMDWSMSMDMGPGKELDLTSILFYETESGAIYEKDQQSSTPSSRPLRRFCGKKRAPRACTNCNVRKVRCDAVAHGTPCANCTYFHGECVLPTNRLQKKK